MSTSLLYSSFGIRGYRYVRTEYSEAAVLFTIEHDGERLRCPICGSAKVTAHGGEGRLFRLVPIGSKLAHLYFQVPRVECHRCQITRQVEVAFADRRRRYTH